MTRIEKIASLYEAITGDATPTAEELDVYAGLADTVTLEAISATLTSKSPLAFDAMPKEDLLDYMYMNLFSYTQSQLDAIKATPEGQAGYGYWANELDNNSDVINVNTLAIALLNGAAPADEAKATSKVASLVADYEEYKNNAPEEVGETYTLTSGTDNLTGTDKADTFDAPIIQNSFAGGVSNSLSSADKLDGGAGKDTLDAELVGEFVGTTTFYQVDVQPQTKNIENVTFEARDSGANDDDQNTLVTVDAKKMLGVEKIGSKFSDGDLIIENLTTLDNDGETIRNTSEMTVTMDHTDNTNTDDDASDLKVLFDDDYLVTGKVTSGAELTIRMLNAVKNAQGENPIEGFTKIKFNVGGEIINGNVVGGTEISVDVTSVANDSSLNFQTAYNAVVSLINAELANKGFANITASAAAAQNAVFSIPVSTYNTGDSAGVYYPIVLKNSGAESLIGVAIETYDLSYDTDLNNSFTADAPETNDEPISINIELEKVGRKGDGGDLEVGGKQSGDAGSGIHTFNVTVLGDESKPSNLKTMVSTNSALKVVNIASEARTDDSYASLTVRDSFGGTLETLNANNFKGDLTIGSDTAAVNIDTFTATGGGNVTLHEHIGAENAGTAGSFPSLDKNEYTVTTANGNDTITMDTNSGAQVTVNSGAGDDTISIEIDGQDDSGSTLTKAFISSTGGNNTVTVSSADAIHEAEITLGDGNDTVTANSVNATIKTGAGNDTIYTDNTGQKAVIVNTAADNTLSGTAITVDPGTGTPATPDQTELLYGRSVVVTLATAGATADENAQGYESKSVEIEASNNYLTTTADLHNAIAKAINEDAILSKLASASVDSNGKLTVTYLVDGAIDVDTDAALEYTISGAWSGLTATEQNGIRAQLAEEYSNSDIATDPAGATATANAYNTTAITTPQAILDNGNGQDGADSTNPDNNIVNAGLGDDVIVLNSNDGVDPDGNNVIDTIQIDENGFGNDVVVHFETGNTGDVLDFAHLNNVTSSSTSVVSQQDIVGTYLANTTAMVANSVALATLANLTDNDANATNAMTFATLTSAGVLAEMNASVAEFDINAGALPTDLVGANVNSVMLVEDNANAGYYKVFEVVYNVDSSNFTEANLVGTLDFEATITLADENIA